MEVEGTDAEFGE